MRNLRSTEEEERVGLRGIREKIDDNAERKPQVRKGEPGEDEGEDVILRAGSASFLTADLLSPKRKWGYIPMPGCGRRTSE